MISPHTPNFTNPNQGKHHNQGHPHLKHQEQRIGPNQVLQYPEGVSRPSMHTKPLQPFGSIDATPVIEPYTSFNSFGSLGLESVLAMPQNRPNGARFPENRSSFAQSNALDAADLQFSGYLLNGGGNSNNSGLGFGRNYYSGCSSAQSEKGSGGCRENNTQLFGSLGMANTSSLGTQQLNSGRYSSITSPGIGNMSGSAGISSSQLESSSSYSASPLQAFSSTNSMPLLGYNSYTSLLNKANLMFESNLDTMMIDWTLEERECCRRLVQFWRRHENNNIFCTFKAVAAADRVPNSIVVSCIYWEEKQDFFITSVDCIHLLESLIAVRFTVEEKNRIRRNLEGFRPLTVSKCKSESADFFKLIMSFPNPKPRNIEKDVKVFPWRILPLALKKIIGKYTASYSSTSSVALESYPSSRPACYSRLAGMPLSTSTGGMATFAALSTAPGNMLGASSATAAVVAAAAAAAAAGGSETTKIPTSMPNEFPQNTFDTQHLPLNTKPEHREAFRLTLGMNTANSSKPRGTYLSPQSRLALSTSVPASDSSDQDYSSLLVCGDPKRKINRPATTPFISKVSDDKEGYTEASRVSGDADNQNASSFILSQACTGQLDFAGMATDASMAFLCSGVSDKQTSAAPLSSPMNFFDQLAADYAISRSDYPPQLPKGQDDKVAQPSVYIASTPQPLTNRVIRNSSTKPNSAQHATTPYSIERTDRHKIGSNNQNFNGTGCRAAFTGQIMAITTSASAEDTLHKSIDRKIDNRGGSPSIPLILEQQQNACHNVKALGSLLGIETASSVSSTMTHDESTCASVEETVGHAVSETSCREASVHRSLKEAFLESATKGLGGRAGILSGGQQPANSHGATEVDSSSASVLDSGMFSTTADGVGSGMFSFGLDGDFSFLASLIAAGGNDSTNSLTIMPSYGNGEVGSSLSSSNTMLALEASPVAAVDARIKRDQQSAEIFSLMQPPGNSALNTIADGQDLLDQRKRQNRLQDQLWPEGMCSMGGGTDERRTETRRIAGLDIDRMELEMPKSSVPSRSVIEQMLSPAITPPQDGWQPYGASMLAVSAAAAAAATTSTTTSTREPALQQQQEDPLFSAGMFGETIQFHMQDGELHRV
ncbi:hypothetical protein IWW48_000316 [Coemansia sp. RSA 1200]|nr:hypothetical protein IWW48_000316 [Coemansia sp. RSA 1200]